MTCHYQSSQHSPFLQTMPSCTAPSRNKSDAVTLQADLDELVVWEKDWTMEFHPKKCKTLRVTNKRNIIEAEYSIHGENLELVESAKYLGVTINKNLKWKQHVDNIAAKATNVRFFFQRNLHSFSKEIKLTCYKNSYGPSWNMLVQFGVPTTTNLLLTKLKWLRGSL